MVTPFVEPGTQPDVTRFPRRTSAGVSDRLDEQDRLVVPLVALGTSHQATDLPQAGALGCDVTWSAV